MLPQAFHNSLLLCFLAKFVWFEMYKKELSFSGQAPFLLLMVDPERGSGPSLGRSMPVEDCHLWEEVAWVAFVEDLETSPSIIIYLW